MGGTADLRPVLLLASNPGSAVHHSLRSFFIMPVVVAGAFACSDASAPTVPPRSYQLVSYGGAALPVTLRRLVETSTQPGGPTTTCDDKLTASNLELLSTKRFMQTDSHLLVCDDGRPDAASQSLLEGSYDAAGDSLVLNAELGSGTYYVGFARISGDSLTIYRREARTTGGGSSTDPSPLVFRSAGRLMAGSPSA